MQEGLLACYLASASRSANEATATKGVTCLPGADVDAAERQTSASRKSHVGRSFGCFAFR